MKTIKSILVVSFVIMSTCCIAQQKDKNTMVENVFLVLKNKNEKGFVNLFPDAALMKEFLVKMMEKDTAPDGMMKGLMNDFLNKMTDSSLQSQYRQQLDMAIKEGEAKGIVWEKASLISYTADSTATNDDGMETSKLSGKIYFDIDTIKYFIQYNNIIWFENKGWYGVSIERIDKKSRENEEEEIMELKEVMIDTASGFLPNDSFVTDKVADVELKTEQPKPVKKAAPAKPASKSTKAKSATPAARKPD